MRRPTIISLATAALLGGCLDEPTQADHDTTIAEDTADNTERLDLPPSNPDATETDPPTTPLDPGWCSGVGAVQPGAVYEEGPVTVVGLITPARGQVCDTTDGGCSCVGGLRVEGGGWALTLTPPADADDGDDVWVCGVEGCDTVDIQCTPMNYGGRYWIKGVAAYEGVPSAGSPAAGSASDAGAMLVPAVLAVEAYCIATTPDGLPGTYRGVVQLDGIDVPLTARVRYGASDGTWVMESAPLPCAHCEDGVSPIPTHEMAVSVGDGVIHIDTVSSAGYPVKATFYSRGNTISGLSNGAFVSLTRVGD